MKFIFNLNQECQLALHKESPAARTSLVARHGDKAHLWSGTRRERLRLVVADINCNILWRLNVTHNSQLSHSKLPTKILNIFDCRQNVAEVIPFTALLICLILRWCQLQ